MGSFRDRCYRSDRYLLTDSENQPPEDFLLHERFEDLWEKRCSILRIGQVSKRGVLENCSRFSRRGFFFIFPLLLSR
jgi:hypothetical protein